MFDNVMQSSYTDSMILFDASTLILPAKIEMLDDFLADFGEKVAISERVVEEVLDRSNPSLEGRGIKAREE